MSGRTPPTIALMFVPGELGAATLQATEGVHRLIRRCPTPRSQPTSYARHLVTLWALRGDLILLEQDKVPPPDWVTQFSQCGRGICTFPYMSNGVLITEGFGCIRFSSTLKALHPDAIKRALGISGGAPRWPTYRQLDTRIHAWFSAYGVVRHIHTPNAEHQHQMALNYA